MALRIWRRVLQGIVLTALLLIITVAVVIWRWHAGGQCLAFGSAYTPIGELKIDGRPYYVYGAVTGFQDKVRIVQVSTTKIPESPGDPDALSGVVFCDGADGVVDQLPVTEWVDGSH